MSIQQCVGTGSRIPQERRVVTKVLVTDTLAPQGLELLERAPGFTVDNAPGLEGAELLAVGRAAPVHRR